MRITDIAHTNHTTQGSDAPEEISPLRARLARILAGSDFPALSQQIIDTISLLDDDASSLQRLANVVLREYSLTISVVRTANSTHYRRTGKPIQSATHAMMMLGARTVRHLASSLLLFENYSKRSDSLKELMLLSLLTANHAREMAVRLGSCDPEEAHLCGMFRNFGEVLVACHFPEDYATIRAAVQSRKQTESGAANDVLGFRYEDLGDGLSRHWGMPDSVMRSMRARPSAPMSDVGAITSFSHDLTAAIYRSHRDKSDARTLLDEVIERYATRLKLSRTTVVEIVEAALAETRELFGSANGNMLRRISADARFALGIRSPGTGEYDATALSTTTDSASLLLREKLQNELEAKIDPSSGINVGNVMLLALEAALRGGPFDRVVACVLNADRTRLIARTALGVNADSLMSQFDFPMTVRGGPVASALLQRQSQYLPSDREMSASESRWAQSMNCAQYGVFPIIAATRIVGCLYVDRADAESVPDAATLAYVRVLCELVSKAISARRNVRPGTSSNNNDDSRLTATPLHNDSVAPNVPNADKFVAQQDPAVWSATLTASLTDGRVLNAESKGALVLRLLQGEDITALAHNTGVAISNLEQWRNEFLAGALSRLG